MRTLDGIILSISFMVGCVAAGEPMRTTETLVRTITIPFMEKITKMTKCVVTITDTFGGEANYGWVKRYEFAPRNADSQRSVIRQAKALANMTSVKADTYDYGDGYTVKPRGYNQVIFVDFET